MSSQSSKSMLVGFGYCAVGIFGLLVLGGAAGAAEPFVAGVKPYERPVGAPTIKEPERGEARDARIFKGITAPVPDHVKQFAKDQGNWYTPFDRPNMPAPYDIRQLYPAGTGVQEKAAAKPADAAKAGSAKK